MNRDVRRDGNLVVTRHCIKIKSEILSGELVGWCMHGCLFMITCTCINTFLMGLIDCTKYLMRSEM